MIRKPHLLNNYVNIIVKFKKLKHEVISYNDEHLAEQTTTPDFKYV